METVESTSGWSHNDDFSPKNNSKKRSLPMKSSQFLDVEGLSICINWLNYGSLNFLIFFSLVDGVTSDDKSILMKELCICMKNESTILHFLAIYQFN